MAQKRNMMFDAPCQADQRSHVGLFPSLLARVTQMGRLMAHPSMRTPMETPMTKNTL